MVAIKAFIEDWLKDPEFYCDNCGMKFYPHIHVQESCCETPMFGRNIDHTMMFIKANHSFKKTLKKRTGASEKGSMRMAVNMPRRLYDDLSAYFKRFYKEKLFNDHKEMRQFMRAFPQFCVPEDV